MKHYFITYGVDCKWIFDTKFAVVKVESIEKAKQIAYNRACKLYDTLAHETEIQTIEELINEEGLTLTEAQCAYEEDREECLDYDAEEATEEEIEKKNNP